MLTESTQVPTPSVFTVNGPPVTVASAQIVEELGAMFIAKDPEPEPPVVETVNVAAGVLKY